MSKFACRIPEKLTITDGKADVNCQEVKNWEKFRYMIDINDKTLEWV